MEPESPELRLFVTAKALVSSELAHAESARGVLRHSKSLPDIRARGLRSRGASVLAGFGLVRVDRPTLILAGRLPDRHLGTLDAIHVATALRLGASLREFVTYDRRQAQAAARAGLNVVQPGLR